MGAVIRFPSERRTAQCGGGLDEQRESATIVILPVVRIERMSEMASDGSAPDSNSAPGRKRRPRSSRT
jgi:hypothetical protein